jgi:hypothetical protein
MFLDGVVEEQVDIKNIGFAWIDDDLEKHHLS